MLDGERRVGLPSYHARSLTKNQRVVGTLHLPASEGRFPAVLILHGFTGNRMEPHFIFVKTSRRLAQNGIASLRIDFRGSGESEGEFQERMHRVVAEEGEGALDFLRERGIDVRTMGRTLEEEEFFLPAGVVAVKILRRESVTFGEDSGF